MQNYSNAPSTYTSQMRVTLLGAIGALCIIAGYSDERMRLLAESGRKSQFYYSPLFRKCPLKVPRGSLPEGSDPMETEEERKKGPAREDVVNPTVKSSFCRVSAS